MTSTTLFLILGMVLTATAYKISPACVNVCESADSTKHDTQGELDESKLSILNSVYDSHVINGCATPCQCDVNVFAYSADKFCQLVQSFVVKSNEGYHGKSVRVAPIDKVNGKDNPDLEAWCKKLCSADWNMGGQLCYCDIIP